MSTDDATPQTLAQLGHHVGLHITVNVQGKTLGGVFCQDEQWVPGKIVGTGALGNSLTIQLDTPIGGGEPHGLFKRPSPGEDMVSIDDASRVRAMTLDEAAPAGVPDEIAELVRAGKTMQALKRYRELNGATLDEAQAYIASLGG